MTYTKLSIFQNREELLEFEKFLDISTNLNHYAHIRSIKRPLNVAKKVKTFKQTYEQRVILRAYTKNAIFPALLHSNILCP